MTAKMIRVVCDRHPKDAAVARFIRVPDGHQRENGYVHRWPRVWLLDSEAYMGRIGPTDPTTGLPDAYVTPRPDRVRSRATEDTCELICRKCRRPPWSIKWDRLTPIFDDAARRNRHAVTLTEIGAILRK